MMAVQSDNYSVVEQIELNPYAFLVIYADSDTGSNDAILIKNKPKNQTLTDFNTRAIKTISKASVRRNAEKRTEIITLEFDQYFLDKVTDWCDSLKITFEQLVYAFIEFLCRKENQDVVKPWIKEMKNDL